jgi:hypothetical protein
MSQACTTLDEDQSEVIEARLRKGNGEGYVDASASLCMDNIERNATIPYSKPCSDIDERRRFCNQGHVGYELRSGCSHLQQLQMVRGAKRSLLQSQNS